MAMGLRTTGAVVMAATGAWAAAPAWASAPEAGSPFALGGPPRTSISWVADLEQALEQAEILRRPIMVDVWAKWCRWCLELDRRTYSDPEVAKRAQAITCAKVNADQEPEVGRHFRIRGLPTILFFDRHGQEIDRIGGFLLPDPFAQSVDDVLAAADRTAERADELKQDPENPARKYALADELVAQGRFAEAEPLLASLTPAGPNAGSPVEPDAVLDLAIVRQGSGDREGACSILTGFLEAYPSSPRRQEAELRLGGLLAEAGKVDQARVHLEAVVAAATAANQNSWKAAEARRLLGLLGSPN
jgi:thioredoxin-like negative regulator of GroEL